MAGGRLYGKRRLIGESGGGQPRSATASLLSGKVPAESPRAVSKRQA
ncbi:hypothetical protein P9A48_gp86 [Xanthomonas phage Mallos]|uniref:Uncharacterized protein n=1 Tax=Xanthomonas phage Mallos TaxID=2939131 RepID=A0A9E7E287_9CAUD|nr:hypothetical protein P9A48_gp86 [Xanthomonas phage Mallos]URA07194.1 hypothetical protein Mallos_BL60086 [Xanthomonas phage Mallos]